MAKNWITRKCSVLEARATFRPPLSGLLIDLKLSLAAGLMADLRAMIVATVD